MMKFLIFILSIPLISFANESCDLVTYNQIIKVNSTQDDSIIKETNCDETIIEHFVNFIQSADGKLNADYLNSYFKNEYSQNISITPKNIEISHIRDLIAQKINNPDAVYKNITSMLPGSSILLDSNEQIIINCNHCDQPGSKNISVEFDQKKYWLNAKVYLKRKTFILTKNVISLNEQLEPSYFKQKTILDDGSQQLFDNVDNVKFYRLTRFLKEGDVLRRGDLTPRQIIRHGQKVKLQYKDPNIELNASAIANGNGKFGDFIQVINPNSKRKILAKVVDFNKVEVEQ